MPLDNLCNRIVMASITRSKLCHSTFSIQQILPDNITNPPHATPFTRSANSDRSALVTLLV